MKRFYYGTKYDDYWKRKVLTTNCEVIGNGSKVGNYKCLECEHLQRISIKHGWVECRRYFDITRWIELYDIKASRL